MNEQKIKAEWKKFEDAFAAYVFDIRHMGTTLKFNDGLSERMTKDLLLDKINEAEKEIEKGIDAIDAILSELD